MSIERKPIVVDSNVLISAALNEDSISAKAFRRALALFSLTRSKATFAEIENVLNRSKLDRFVSLSIRQKFLLDYFENSRDVAIVEEVVACRDPKDDKFLSLAVASGALLLMSGDQDLKVLNPFRGIVIMSPREFLDSFPERVR
jgi:uncharacterized protein